MCIYALSLFAQYTVSKSDDVVRYIDNGVKRVVQNDITILTPTSVIYTDGVFYVKHVETKLITKCPPAVKGIPLYKLLNQKHQQNGEYKKLVQRQLETVD